jgi:hypothetical protein
LPRSIVAWFAVCWGLFLVAALVVGAMPVALYKETTTQRTDRAAGKADYAIAVDRALALFPGVEGGVRQSGLGSLAYAYPTYEGSGQKTGAISEAAGVVPLLRDRLRENEVAQAQFMLVFDMQLNEPHATRWWAEFAGRDRAAFEEQAADLVRPHGALAALRAVGASARTT